MEVLEAKYVLKHATIATCSKSYFAKIGHCRFFMLSQSPKFSFNLRRRLLAADVGVYKNFVTIKEIPYRNQTAT